MAVVALVMTACVDPQAQRSQWQTLPSSGWAYVDTLQFDSVPRTWTPRSIELSVRHSGAYEYANLWVELRYKSGGQAVADTFDVRLCDEFGRWYGHGTGASLQLTDTITPRYRMDAASPVKLRHIMRMDTLTDIEQIGIAYNRQ